MSLRKVDYADIDPQRMYLLQYTGDDGRIQAAAWCDLRGSDIARHVASIALRHWTFYLLEEA